MMKIKKDYINTVKQEGNYKAGEYNGYKYRILRLEGLSVNGYVGLPKGHRYYGMGLWDIPGIDVHGGITYAENTLYMQPESDLWWIGFDTGHICDTNIWEGYPDGIDRDVTYKGFDYVEKEIMKLIDQLTTL